MCKWWKVVGACLLMHSSVHLLKCTNGIWEFNYTLKGMRARFNGNCLPKTRICIQPLHSSWWTYFHYMLRLNNVTSLCFFSQGRTLFDDILITIQLDVCAVTLDNSLHTGCCWSVQHWQSVMIYHLHIQALCLQNLPHITNILTTVDSQAHVTTIIKCTHNMVLSFFV